MPRHFTELEKEHIRERLLIAGRDMFESSGLDKTNIEDIARAAGISKGSFYAFFNSKGDLFMRVYQMERNKLHLLCRQKYDNLDASVDISVLVRGYAKDMQEGLSKRPILNIMYKFRGLDLISEERARDSLLQYNHEMNMEMSSMIQRWMDARGTFSISGRIIAEMLRALNFLRWHDYAIGYDVYDTVIEKLVDSIVSLLQHSRTSDAPSQKSQD